MKIVHVNTLSFGGAARAAIRLHHALLMHEIDSKFIFYKGVEETVNTIRFQDQCPIYKYYIKKILRKFKLIKSQKQKNELNKNHLYSIGDLDIFTFPVTGIRLDKIKEIREADIIHLHWVGDFLDFPTFFIKINKPIVWTFHDRNPLFGGFHLELDYQRNSLELKKIDDYYRDIKLSALKEASSLSIVTPSYSLANIVEKSIFSKQLKPKQLRVIPNSIDASSFNKLEKLKSKKELGFKNNDIIITYVGSKAYHKGFDLFLESIKDIKSNSVKFAVVGISNKESLSSNHRINNLIFLGMISDDKYMSMVYSASSCLIITSREDNLPNVMLEAWFCGCPVLSVPVGGMKDYIDIGFNGLISHNSDPSSIREMILKFIEKKDCFDSEKISIKAKNDFSMNRQANAYIKLYRKILYK